MKICTGCNIEKCSQEFNRQLSQKDGFNPRCKTCCRQRAKLNRVLKVPTVFECPIGDGEIWKPIKETEAYFISNKGRVYSSGYFNGTIGRLIKHIKKVGYPAVGLHINGKQCGFLIHRLIGEYFIPNPENKPVINHINGNINDFSTENLEWANHRENSSHGYNRKHLTSKYTGVCWYKWTNRWVASIRIKDKLTHLGYFKNEQDAAAAYQNALSELGLTNKYASTNL